MTILFSLAVGFHLLAEYFTGIPIHLVPEALQRFLRYVSIKKLPFQVRGFNSSPEVEPQTFCSST